MRIRKRVPTSVRKRKWIAPNGEAKQSWVVYTDTDGERRLKTLQRKRELPRWSVKPHGATLWSASRS